MDGPSSPQPKEGKRVNTDDVVQIKIQEAARKTAAAKRQRSERAEARQVGIEQRHRAKLAHLAAKDTAAVERVRTRIRYVLGRTPEQVAAERGVPLEWATGYADAARDFAAELDGTTTPTPIRNPPGLPPELPPAA
jgi:hypothetical protein